jgi:diphthamide biosynthesis protein 3
VSHSVRKPHLWGKFSLIAAAKTGERTWFILVATSTNSSTTSRPSHTEPPLLNTAIMSDDENLSIYDEIEIEDMTFDEALQLYHYPCPCGDRFQIALDDLRDEQDIAVCPSCSLMIRVIFDLVSASCAFGRHSLE